ncbi:MAG: DUF4388 domain-containing protein, partial [Cyanobacteria bacterium HKST-UBA02]|nr:DUF4388 domain-containing protein [Cyanobacteria bacterium HKST-UBA02]
VLSRLLGYGKKLLEPGGMMIFIKSDGAIALTRDDPAGGLVINSYDSPYGAFIRFPAFADHACRTVSGLDRDRLLDGGGTLAHHILLASIPVLTEMGLTAKHEFNLPVSQNWLMQLIDDYTPVESLLHRMEVKHKLTPQETLIILQELDDQRMIFPIFKRIQFLSSCYQNRKPFRLGHFMVACGILSEPQLQVLLEQQQEEGWDEANRTFLGILTVRSGYISMRQLQVLLADQYLYGGYHRLLDQTLPGGSSGIVEVNTVADSMIGSLGAIDPPGLLQSLNTANKSGLLTSENRDRVLVVAFTEGRPSHAKMNELRGFDALCEFITTWSDGIFVFRDGGESRELNDECNIVGSLDRVLLDSALFGDNMNQILSSLDQGKDTILERVPDFSQAWQDLESQPLAYIDESPVTSEDRLTIGRLALQFDGLSTVDEVVRNFSEWPAHKIIKVVDVLFQKKLLSLQKGSLFKPLAVFQDIVLKMREKIGSERNKVLLHSSLHYAHGDSPARTRFHIDQEGLVSVNMGMLKSSGVSASLVLPELRQWMEAYIAYCKQEVNPDTVDRLVTSSIDVANSAQT